MGRFGNAERITKTSFLVASVFLFVLSVVTAIGRIAIRLHYQKSLAVDDVFLILAVVFLISALGVLYTFVSSQYLIEALATHDPNVIVPSDIVDQIHSLRKLNDTFSVLASTSIFAVKFSFLFLFKALIRNVRNMNIYWWTVFWTTAAAWVFLIIEVFLLCPQSRKCEQISNWSKVLDWSIAITVENILTDVMIIVIPMILLWRVQIKFQQKLALGFTLCLSIIMIITALVRISGIYASTNTLDITWMLFWEFVEACIAVIMVSLTAFRSIFVAHVSGAQSPTHKPSLRKRLLNSRIAVGRKRAGENNGEETEALPKIPRATMTGMRTLIRGGRAEGSVMKSEGSGQTGVSRSLEDGSADQTIRVEHDMWQKSGNASSHTINLSDHQLV